MDTVKTLIDKFDVQVQVKNHNDEDKEKERERLNKIFEKKQVGRPVGSWEEKRQQYIEMFENQEDNKSQADNIGLLQNRKEGEQLCYDCERRWHIARELATWASRPINFITL